MHRGHTFAEAPSSRREHTTGAQSNSEDGQCTALSAGQCQALHALTPLSKRRVTGRDVGGQEPGVGAGEGLHGARAGGAISGRSNPPGDGF